jgi:nicotinamide mononucleotide (NMN) deamidase PncC
LKVKEKTIQDNTLVSGEVADEMAIGCSHFFNTDCAISLTDVHDGIVYVGIKIIDIVKHYKITTLSNERNAMRAEICADALIKLYSLLKDM